MITIQDRLFQFQSPDQTPMRARMVGMGMAYGRDMALRHTAVEPMIEFYDLRYPHTLFGQLVSRYEMATVQDAVRRTPGGSLNLDGGTPSWTIGASALASCLAQLGPVAQEMREQAQEILSHAWANYWSDALLQRVFAHVGTHGTTQHVLSTIVVAGNDLVREELRQGDTEGGRRGALALGFASLAGFKEFRKVNPTLCETLNAQHVLAGEASMVRGPIVASSMAEVVFQSEAGLMAFQRTRLKTEPIVGREVRLRGLGPAEMSAGLLDTPSPSSYPREKFA